MQKLVRSSALLTALIVAAITLSGCAPSSYDVKKYAAIIDVRTVDEYAAGHLEGAVNMDIESPAFATQITALDKTKSYLLYCHSGRRAGLAVDQMKASGFTGELVNAGGIADATASTGLPIVTN
jgi:rhodanese-related sulfurtransferase